MIDLKPCPFCGREIKLYGLVTSQEGIERLDIDCCMDIRIESDPVLYADDGRYIRTGLDALQKWNRRENEH